MLFLLLVKWIISASLIQTMAFLLLMLQCLLLLSLLLLLQLTCPFRGRRLLEGPPRKDCLLFLHSKKLSLDALQLLQGLLRVLLAPYP